MRALALLVLISSAAYAGDRGEVHAAVDLYGQPASGDDLLVITPTVTGNVHATDWLQLDASWSADVVTGATLRIYAPVDVVSAATRFTEVRNSIGGGAAATIGPATLSAGYAYGIESDYRSHQLRLGARLDLFQHNTAIDAAYRHGFDSVCDLRQPGVPVTLRQPLDASRGCFSGNVMLTEESLGIDTVELAWTQTLSKQWILEVTGSYQHLSGFQSNPYRRVWLSGGLFQAQESHPRTRDRGALTARLRYAIERWRSSLGLDLRLYRDSWSVQSITGDVSWDQPIRKRWRIVAHARGYGQSRAFFFREAKDYDRLGPVGQYFTADQALAPLADLVLGARASYSLSRPEKRYLHAFTDLALALSFEYLKIFSLVPNPPNAPRTQGFASALSGGLSFTGEF